MWQHRTRTFKDERTPEEIDKHPNTWYRAFNPNFKIDEQPLHTRRPLRLIIIGAGACGLLAAYKATRQLKNVTFVVYEKNNDVGGTWYENRYPGLEIDSPSHTYQWTFHRNPKWSKFQAPGREVLEYLKEWAVEADILKDVKLGHQVESVVWDDDKGVWEVQGQTAAGETFTDRAEITICVNGGLNTPKMLNVPGIDMFKRPMFHTGAWPEDIDLGGKTVAVIGGAGASGIQLIPAIQPLVRKLIVYQRSKFWGIKGEKSKFVGKAKQNFEYSEEQIHQFTKKPELAAQYQRDVEAEIGFLHEAFHRGGRLHDRIVSINKHETVKAFGEEKAQQYIPDYGFGCRRSSPSAQFPDALNAENVEVIQASVVGFTESGIIDSNGGVTDADTVICATSYSAFMPSFRIIGRDGRNLGNQIRTTGKSYLSLMNEDFPNMFYIPSTNSPVNHGAWLPMAEAYMRYAFKMLTHMQRTSIKSFAPKRQAIDDYYIWTHELMKRLSVSYPCYSWFKKDGLDHAPVVAVYAGSRAHFYEVLKEPRMEDFNVEHLGNRFTYFGNGFTKADMAKGADVVWYLQELEDDIKAGHEAYDLCPARPVRVPADPGIVIPKVDEKSRL